MHVKPKLSILLPTLMLLLCFSLIVGANYCESIITSEVAIITPRNGDTLSTPQVTIEVTLTNVDPETVKIILNNREINHLFLFQKQMFAEKAVGQVVLNEGEHRLLVQATGSAGSLETTSRFFVKFSSYFTPDDAVNGTLPTGINARIRGVVSAVTHESLETPPNYQSWANKVDTITGATSDYGRTTSFHVQHERYILLKIENTEGLTPAQAAWGVGVMLTLQQWAVERIALPYPGDFIEVEGTLDKRKVNDEERLVITPVLSLETISSPNPVLKDIDDTCTHDMDCRDDLICERKSKKCKKAPPLGWSSSIRGINGACDTDEDCPLGQFCHPQYNIKGEGPFAAHYYRERDIGRQLCQVYDRNAATETICPRVVSADDVLSGRFAESKEVCVRDRLFLTYFNPGDNDTHVQYIIRHPSIYPLGFPPLAISGFASENAPPYKDPDNPFGRLPDPPDLREVIMLGTVKYDGGHMWYEIHPFKWYRNPESAP